MPFHLQMSKNITQQRDIYDTVIFRLLKIFYGLSRLEAFTLELTVNKEVLKVVICSFPLMLTMNKGTEILLEKLKATPATKQ